MNTPLHHVPGRLRVKVPALKDKPWKRIEIERLFAGQNGIAAVTANTLTGSVIVHYDSHVTGSEKILRLMNQAGLVEANRLMESPAHWAVDKKAADYIGRALFGYAMGKALESSGLGFLAALI
jgi:hypothetical protein